MVRKMANATPLETRPQLPPRIADNPPLPNAATFFRAKGYLPTTLRTPEGVKCLFKMHLYDSSAICDLLILAEIPTLQEAEQLIPKLEQTHRYLQKVLLRGIPFGRGLEPQEHHFLTLRRPYKCHSYQYHQKPVGFFLHPLIILTQEDSTFEYLAGKSIRINVLSQEEATLQFYLQHHRTYLDSHQPSLLKRRKNYYWKVANYMLDYGHYPLIGCWVADLLCAIFQVPFPLSMGGMLFLTAFIYSSFIGLAYMLFRLFKYAQITEFQSSIPSFPGMSEDTPFLHESAPEEELLVLEDSDHPRREASGSSSDSHRANSDSHRANSDSHRANSDSHRAATPAISTSEDSGLSSAAKSAEFYRLRLKKQFKAFIQLRDSATQLSQGRILLQYALKYFLIVNQLNAAVPRNATLKDLFQLIHKAGKMPHHSNALHFWLEKLETQTPFLPEELHAFKQFLLIFIAELGVIAPDALPILTLPQKHVAAPPSASRESEGKGQTSSPQESTSHPNTLPETNSQASAAQTRIQKLEKELQELRALVKSKDGAKPPSPVLPSAPPKVHSNLDVASLPTQYLENSNPVQQQIYTKIPQISLEFFWKMRSSSRAGIYCILLLDLTAPDAVDLLNQFEASMLDYHINVDYMDVSAGVDPLLEREFGALAPPVVLVGCGQESQVIPISGQDWDHRLHAAVQHFLTPNGELTLKPKHPKQDQADRREQAGKKEIEEGFKARADPFITNSGEKRAELEERQVPNFPKEAISESSRRITDQLVQAHHIQRFKKGSVFVDGSNVAFLLKDRYDEIYTPKIICIEKILDRLREKGISSEKIIIYFDSNIAKQLQKADPQGFANLQEHWMVQKVPAGTKADTAMVERARRLNRQFLVVSNDRFQDEPPWFAKHRVPVMLDIDDVPVILIDDPRNLVQLYYGVENTQKGGK